MTELGPYHVNDRFPCPQAKPIQIYETHRVLAGVTKMATCGILEKRLAEGWLFV